MNTLDSISTEILIDWLATGLYGILILIVWQAIRRAPNQLLWSIFAFAAGMGLFKFFEGASEFLEIPFLLNFGLLGAMVGDAFTLRFPLQEVSAQWREKIFYGVLAIGIFIFFLLIMFPATSTNNSPLRLSQAQQEAAETASHNELNELDSEDRVASHQEKENDAVHEPSSRFSWLAEIYLIIISGVISGGYMIWRGIQSTTAWIRVKSIGGGIGLAGCCIAIERAALLFGVGITSSVPLFAEIIGAAAPLIVIFAILYGRYLQNTPAQTENLQ